MINKIFFIGCGSSGRGLLELWQILPQNKLKEMDIKIIEPLDIPNELLDKYKNVIIEQQNKKIKILENDLKKQDYPQEGRCYIFEETDELGEKYYRIGQSDNLKNRMKTHNSSSPHNKIVVFEIKTKDIYHYEKCLRATLYKYNYKNKTICSYSCNRYYTFIINIYYFYFRTN